MMQIHQKFGGKHMKTKRILSLVPVLSLLAALFAGCGSQPAVSGDSKSASADGDGKAAA